MSENDTSLKGIGERVKAARKELGLTQEQFADKYGYPRTTLAKLEAGLRDFKSTELLALAEQLNVSCDYLLGRTVAKLPDNFIQEVCKRYGLTESALATLEWLAAPLNFSNEVVEQVIEKQRVYQKHIADLIRALPLAEQQAYIDDILPVFDAIKLQDEHKLTPREQYILGEKIQSDINRDNLQALNELLTVSTKRAIDSASEGGSRAEQETYGLLILHGIYSYCHKKYKPLTAYNEEWGTDERTPAETLRASNLSLITRYCSEFSDAVNADKVVTAECLRKMKRAAQLKAALPGFIASLREDKSNGE